MSKKSNADAIRPLVTSWINEVVRDSNYRIQMPVDFSEINAMSSEDLAFALLSIEGVERDKKPGALLPPRLPIDISPASAMSSVDGVAKTCEALMNGHKPAHPAVFHAILAHAMNFEDDDERMAAIKATAPLFKGQKAVIRNSFYQPTIFQVAMVHPDWFTAPKNIRPTIRGAELPNDMNKGMVTSFTLVRNKMRINPAELLTHPHVVKANTAMFTETHQSWKTTAEEGFSGYNPLASSAWVMGYGDKEMFWDWMPPGAALFSPFYSNGEVDALFANAVAATEPGFYLRMGAGIADIFPFHDDAVLAGQLNTTVLLEAPMSLGTLLSMQHMNAHPGCPFEIGQKWADSQFDRYTMAKILDMIPANSAFFDKVSEAPRFLSEIKDAQDPVARFNAFSSLIGQIMTVYQRDGDPGQIIAFASPRFDYGTRLYRHEGARAVSPIIPEGVKL